MGGYADIKTLQNVVLAASLFQTCRACTGQGQDESGCWYTLWYIWFVLALFVVVIAVLVVLYIKHRSKERSRTRRRRRSTRTVPIHIVPTQPPGYAEPSHKPPSYDEAMQLAPNNINSYNNIHNTTHTNHNAQLQVPGVIPYNYDDYGYQPPPTSMRMVTSIQGTSPQPQPPSYAASTQGHGHPS